MFELLLSGLFVEEPVTGPPPFLLYDPVVGRDIIGNNITEVITGSGVTVNANRLLNGFGVKEFAASGNGQVKVNFTNPLNFDNGDWTIEYDSIVDTFPGTSVYANSFYMFSSTANQYLFTAFGNLGEGLQAEFFKATHVNGNYSNTWRYGQNRINYEGIVRRTAIVKKGNVINIYYNGSRVIAQNLLSGQGGTNTENIPNVVTGLMPYMLLGYINSSFPSYKGAFGRFAIYDYPRYTKASYKVMPIVAT